jgi:hypothetical protein
MLAFGRRGVGMLTWLIRSIGAIALVNVAALVALGVAYAWHHGLKPMREHRRTRQRAFDRLLGQSIPDSLSTTYEREDAHRSHRR